MTPEALAEIHLASITHSAPWSASVFAQVLGMPGAFLVTNAPHAFAIGRVAANEAELLTLAVHPEAQRQGLGAECLERFEQTAQSMGADLAFLEVAATNTPAIALYRAAEWQKDGVRKGYYRSGPAPVDAVLMSKPLATS